MDQQLTLRADGWAELPNGSVAVVMKVATRREGESVTFVYRPTFTDAPIKLEWHKDDLLQIFPLEISLKIVANKWADRPTKELVDRYNAAFVPVMAIETVAEAEKPSASPETQDTASVPTETLSTAEQPAKRRGRPPKQKSDEGDHDDQAQV